MHLTTHVLTNLLVFTFISVQAQHARILGKVFQPDDSPLAYANITLNNELDSSLVKIAITDEEGKFQFGGIKPGAYWINISYIGFPHLRKTINLSEEDEIHLEDLKMLEPTSTGLDEVVVTAERPLLELENDKMIFNVESSINATGDNGLELLRKAPGVLIDNNDNITILGKAGVRIHINGKPSPLRGADLAAYLESLQSMDIEAIEIITNPGSKYEAEGTAGIINLRMKKNKALGSNGSLNLGYAIGIRPRYKIGGSGNYRNNWMNAYANYSFVQNHWLNQMLYYRTQHGYTVDERYDNHGSFQPQTFKAGVDLFLSEKSTLGLLVDGGIGDFNVRVRNKSTLSDFGATSPDSLLLAGQISSGDRFNINYNLNYLWQIKKGSSLTIDANYGTFSSERREFQPNYYTDITGDIILSQKINESFAPRDIQIVAFKADYETSLWQGTLGAGIKVSKVNTDNDFQFFNIIEENKIIDIDRTNYFKYEENIRAAYINFNRKLYTSVDFQLGLRLEDTRSTGQLIAQKPGDNNQVDRAYLDWFPSANLNITVNEANLFQLSYSRRINRPSYQALNPFEYKLNELTFHRGNPFLQPEYSNVFQLRHSLKYKLNTTLSYSHTVDMMVLQIVAGEQKEAIRSWMNLSNQHDYSINIAAPTTINNWWSSFASLTAYYRENKGKYDENVIDIARGAYNLYSQQTFNLHKDFSLQVSGSYYSPTIVQANFIALRQWFVDIGIKTKVLNKSGNLTIALSDIFKTNYWRGEWYFGGLDGTVRNRWDSQRLKIDLTYFFGNQQVKKARNRVTGLDEEKERTQGQEN